jgi:hypothetical protein
MLSGNTAYKQNALADILQRHTFPDKIELERFPIIHKKYEGIRRDLHKELSQANINTKLVSKRILKALIQLQVEIMLEQALFLRSASIPPETKQSDSKGIIYTKEAFEALTPDKKAFTGKKTLEFQEFQDESNSARIVSPFPSSSLMSKRA